MINIIKSKINSFKVYIKYYLRKNSSLEDLFSSIYETRVWGSSSNSSFYSGSGSHEKKIIKIYQSEIRKFTNNFKNKPSAIDLGCGDFNVGKSIRKYFSKYYAFDVVGELIEYNKNKYKYLNVTFKQMNALNGNLPIADIIMIREVFQHLSNANINKILNKIKKKYKFLILTEVISRSKKYKPNLDQSDGPIVRRAFKNSGIDISKSPFNFIYKKKIKSFSVRKGIKQNIVTTFYEI